MFSDLDFDVFTVLSLLGIPFSYEDMHGNELRILCPFHQDLHKGSFSININTWKYNCFSGKCGIGGIGPIKFISDYLCIDYFEAKKWLLESRQLNSIDVKNYVNYAKKLEEDIKELKKIDPLDYYPKNIKQLSIDNSYYCDKHHISQLFVDNFNWSLVTDGYYKDYILVPIYKDNELFSFEVRKLYEYEKLCEFYKIDFKNNKRQYDYLKEKFKKEGFKLTKNKTLLKNGVKYIELDKKKYFLILYLIKPKVLYPKNSKINQIIFNIDNLSIEKSLYLVESSSSLPNIWLNLLENVTSVFGSRITDEQIKILSYFKEIIIIPDNDDAGLLMTEYLRDNLFEPNLLVLPVETDAGEASKEELRQESVDINRFLWRNRFKLAKLNEKKIDKIKKIIYKK